MSPEDDYLSSLSYMERLGVEGLDKKPITIDNGISRVRVDIPRMINRLKDCGYDDIILEILIKCIFKFQQEILEGQGVEEEPRDDIRLILINRLSGEAWSQLQDRNEMQVREFSVLLGYMEATSMVRERRDKTGKYKKY